jgi:pilus assembly protein CpaD
MPQNRIHAAAFLMFVGILLLVGCNTSTPMPSEGRGPAEISKELPPKRTRVELVALDHDVDFARGSKTVTASGVAGLSNFLRDNAVGEGDSVTVAGPNTASALTAARRAAVLAELNMLHVHAVPATVTAPVSSAVRVHVDHVVVTAPQCPDWSKPEADNPDNTSSSNFGCATEANLAAMVANPADLARGRPSGMADGEALARGVELYKSGNLAKTLSGSSGYSTSGLSGTGGSAASGSGSGGGSQ